MNKILSEYESELAAAVAVHLQPKPSSAFDRTLAASVAHTTLTKAVHEATAEVREVKLKQQKVAADMASASCRLREAKTALRQFEPLNAEQRRKRQRTAAGSPMKDSGPNPPQ